MSAHLIGLRFGSGIDAVVDQAKRYADAGLDLGIVYLPTPLHATRCSTDSPPRSHRSPTD